MKTKELFLILLLYIVVCIAALFCYKKLFDTNDTPTPNGNNQNVNSNQNTNEVLKVGDQVQCIGSINLRSSAEIDDGIVDNVVKKNAQGYLGTIVLIEKNQTETWCKVKLEEPVYEFLFPHEEIFVLESEITKL